MKKSIGLIVLLCASCYLGLAQNTSLLSAAELFEKVVQYYDPNGVWDEFQGSMHMHTIFADGISEEDLTIDNAKDFYRSVNYLPDGTYTKGVSLGEVFFKAKGAKLVPDDIPDELKKGPYGLNEQAARRMQEHHRAHFSLPLMLDAAGAEPLPEVSTKTLFGTECVGISFSGLPEAYENGFYNIPFTLYLDPENDYRLHASHVDNGWWTDKKGVITLFSGELEIDGLKIPARKLYFHAANLQYALVDVFDLDIRVSE